jgi:hypothetical protein
MENRPILLKNCALTDSESYKGLHPLMYLFCSIAAIFHFMFHDFLKRRSISDNQEKVYIQDLSFHVYLTTILRNIYKPLFHPFFHNGKSI